MEELDSIQLIENKLLNVTRPVYNQKQFDDEFRKNKDTTKSSKKPSFRCKSLLKWFDLRRLINVFTIFNLIAEYNIKRDLLADVLSGVTVGIMHIPAGLAYGALTSLNPVNGLYVSFYSSIIYILFGTSKHLSIGTYAVVSLMVLSTIQRLEADYIDTQEFNTFKQNLTNQTEENSAQVEQHIMDFRLKVAISLAFWCGIVQVALALFRIGKLYKYLSTAAMRGFTTAAACYVFTTQLKHVLGIYPKTKNHLPVLKLIIDYKEMILNVKTFNLTAVIISFISITFLVTMKIHVNERFKKQLHNIPIPIELIVIIFGTLFSYLFGFHHKFGLAIVGKIPSGLSKFSLPDFSFLMFKNVIQDAIIIAIVTFTSTISVCDVYARKHKYKIDSNKELFSLGMANIVGSFLECFICCGALARTAVFESSGGRTQVVTIVASGILLAVLLWISPLLEALPKACLGSIIISALINMFKQFKDVKHYWNLDKYDFSMWVITFLSCILLDISYGLCVGILAVFIINVYRSQKLDVLTLAQIKQYEIHSDILNYNVNEYEDIKIVQPTQSIYYINSDNFHSQINELCPLKETIAVKSLLESCASNYGCAKEEKEKNFPESLNMISANGDKETKKQIVALNAREFKIMIIDFSRVNFVDENGVKCLQKIFNEYKKDGVRVLFTSCNKNVREFFIRMNCKWEEFIYLSIKDAIIFNSC